MLIAAPATDSFVAPAEGHIAFRSTAGAAQGVQLGTIAGEPVVSTGLAAGGRTPWHNVDKGETVTFEPGTDVLLYGTRDRNYPVIAGGSGGGGGTYTAQAIHNDGTCLLSNEALQGTGIDNQFWSFSYWMKNVEGTGGFSAQMLTVDPDDAYTNSIVVSGSSVNPDAFSPSWDTTDATATNQTQGSFYTFVDRTGWHHHLLSIDTNHPTGAKVVASYVDGVREPLAPDGYEDDEINNPDGAYTMVWAGLKVNILDDGFSDSAIGDFADFWCAPGVSLLDGTGDIPEAARLKFRTADGKPVDLGADGSRPTGTAPAIFFSGDASTFGTNKGTGGAFTLTGTLTNATTSPSNDAGGAAQRIVDSNGNPVVDSNGNQVVKES